jgi:uncharacterized protein (TIGR02996 family)
MSVDAALALPDPADRLLALLDIWWRTPDPDLAELIDHIDSELPSEPYAGSKVEQQKVFTRHAEDRALVELPRMLATLRAQKVRSFEILMSRLLDSGWPDDPRLMTFFMQILEKPPYTSRPIRPAFNGLFTRAKTTADARIAALKGRDLAPAFAGGQMGAYINRRRAATVDKRTFETSLLAESDRSRVREALEERRGARPDVVDLETLLEAVYAEPASDEARLVYADALMDAGNAHGELIQLQLLPERSPDQIRRVRTLIDTHAADWLGPIHKVIASNGEFERGFLTGATLEARSAVSVRAALGDPRWQTVQRVALPSSGVPNVVSVLRHPVCNGITAVVDARSETLRELGDALPNLETLELVAEPWEWGMPPPEGEARWAALQSVTLPDEALPWLPWITGGRHVEVIVTEPAGW